jgi:hypothetical protein
MAPTFGGSLRSLIVGIGKWAASESGGSRAVGSRAAGAILTGYPRCGCDRLLPARCFRSPEFLRHMRPHLVGHRTHRIHGVKKLFLGASELLAPVSNLMLPIGIYYSRTVGLATSRHIVSHFALFLPICSSPRVVQRRFPFAARRDCETGTSRKDRHLSRLSRRRLPSFQDAGTARIQRCESLFRASRVQYGLIPSDFRI